MTNPLPVAAGDRIRIEPVRTARDLRRFIRLPWRIYVRDPHWVPPLVWEQKKLLDRSRHPFHKHAEVEYFLAWKGARLAGRIAAVLNHRHIDFHQEQTGHFGFFETENDPGVAAALFLAAEKWLAERGMDSIVGPMNFTTNDESHSPGILIDGFETPPFILMAHGRPYYRNLLEGAGYKKDMDLLAYLISTDQPPERITKAVARIEAGILGLDIRQIDLKRLPEEVAIVQEIYNSAWERNWGFVPLTEAEIAHLAKELKPIIEPRYALIAAIHGKPVGFSLTLPDFNQALCHANGRLFPLGLAKILWHARHIDRARAFALGLKPEARDKGIDVIFYLKAFEAARTLGHTRGGECSWILEENWKMRRALEKVGAQVYKTYRVYRKRLEVGARQFDQVASSRED